MKTMIKCLVMFAVLLGMFVGSPGNSYAITNGQPDGEEHPYVGVAGFFDASGEPITACSGALISPRVFLTAGHCTSVGEIADVTVIVTFGTDIFDEIPDTPISGVPHTHPLFSVGGQGLPGFDTHDVGVIILDVPVDDVTPAQLPDEGFVDTLPKKTDVTIVGYGFQWQSRGIPPHVWYTWGERMYASSKLIPSNDVISEEFVKLSQNPAQGKGGICFGDSGGPDLQSGTNIILSINSFGNNYNCTGVNYSNRIDTPDVLGWLESWINAPNP